MTRHAAGREGLPAGYRAGVGIMLLDAANRVFIARRTDSVEAWQMPQGGIDRGEKPRDAAMRELKEEIGTNHAEILGETARWLHYDLPPELAATLWHGHYRGQAQKWFAMRFLGRDADIDLDTHHPEFDAWRWAAPAELPGLIVPFKRRLYLDVLAEFSPLLGG